MSSFRSSLHQASSSIRGFASRSEHELPYWNESGRKTTSPLPPPPITASIEIPDTMLAMERREKHLQHDLQFLLDAQAEGLMAGLGGEVPDDLASNGSSTPTAQSIRSSRVVPVRQPVQKKIGLRGARRGIWRAIRELAEIKAEEAAMLQEDMDRNHMVLSQIEGWEKKREGLDKQIEDIRDNEDGSRAQSLKHEADSLQNEINEMELRLSEMRTRHRLITAELSVIENSVQSKLSSYTASLSLLDSQVQNFLARPPVQLSKSPTTSSSFLSLPPKRRTLYMAKDHWTAENAALQKRREKTEIELEALQEGAVVWKDAVHEVTDFEKRLQESMRTAPSPEELLSQMGQTVTQLESKLKLAETRNWKLLVCCIGAELEAFRQGREILESTLSSGHDAGGTQEQGESSPDSPEDSRSGGSDIHELDAAFDNGHPSLGGRTYDTEDDEPDPELLISHQDTDTD
ncbi:hypothetical protein LTR39_000580 [Cryomyces antarcticus]|nr:hypothetical protein LTR39_000580 [Cryomyces antarcticus]